MTVEIEWRAVDPTDPLAREAMDRYYAELDARFPEGFDPGPHTEDDDASLRAPQGTWIAALARIDEAEPVLAGGGGVRTFPDYAEVKRVWVSPDVRGVGLGRQLMDRLEQAAAELGHTVVKLDTNENLPEAIRMYERLGYERVERYNDNPYPTHFFAKTLG